MFPGHVQVGAGCEAGEAMLARQNGLHASALGTDIGVPEQCQALQLSRPQTAGGLCLSLNTWNNF